MAQPKFATALDASQLVSKLRELTPDSSFDPEEERTAAFELRQQLTQLGAIPSRDFLEYDPDQYTNSPFEFYRVEWVHWRRELDSWQRFLDSRLPKYTKQARKRQDEQTMTLLKGYEMWLQHRITRFDERRTRCEQAGYATDSLAERFELLERLDVAQRQLMEVKAQPREKIPDSQHSQSTMDPRRSARIAALAQKECTGHDPDSSHRERKSSRQRKQRRKGKGSVVLTSVRAAGITKKYKRS